MTKHFVGASRDAVRERSINAIVAALQSGPLTGAQLAAAAGLAPCTVYKWLRVLSAQGKIHCAGTRYGLGPGAPAPEVKRRGRRASAEHQRVLQGVLEALHDGPRSTRELAAALGVSTDRISFALCELRAAGKVIQASARKHQLRPFAAGLSTDPAAALLAGNPFGSLIAQLL